MNDTWMKWVISLLATAFLAVNTLSVSETLKLKGEISQIEVEQARQDSLLRGTITTIRDHEAVPAHGKVLILIERISAQVKRNGEVLDDLKNRMN